jgi:uncharacterized OB-fold protein
MPRKLPALTADNRAFWQGGEQGKLLIHHCDACTRFFHPPSPMCPKCASFDVAPRPVSGKGSVASFTVNHQAWTAELEAPYVVAIVELLEQPGLRFLSNVVDCDPHTVRIGMRVKVRFEQVEDVWLPLFEKDQ